MYMKFSDQYAFNIATKIMDMIIDKRGQINTKRQE